MPADFSWVEAEQELTPAALTVRAQAMSPNDNGALLWDVFFPRQNVNSIRLADLFGIDDRVVADRRAWGARGRYIPVLTPSMREMTMVPIESYDAIDEYEQQILAEGTFGDQTIFRDQIRVRVPERVDRLATADYRRLEMDAFQAWSLGSITQRNPQNPAQSYTMSFGFDVARYQTALTSWATVTSAYEEFLAWYEDGVDAAGPGVGAVMRQATFREILKDAPLLPNGVSMTRTQLAERISQDLGVPFQFYILENSLDVFTTGGITTARTKVWPAHKVAYVPAGLSVGNAAFAPVRRAMDLANAIPEAGIDVRGVTVFYDDEAMGRELRIEAQLNAAPLPNEQKLWVIDALV
jgi:hypothetical protein